MMKSKYAQMLSAGILLALLAVIVPVAPSTTFAQDDGSRQREYDIRREGPRFLAEYAASKLLDTAIDAWRGIPDARDLKKQIDELAKEDRVHAQMLRELSYKIDDSMTREQVRSLVMEAMSKMDQRLTRMLILYQQQQEELKRLAASLNLTYNELALLKPTVGHHEIHLSRHDIHLAGLDTAIEEIRRDYPRWEPNGQAIHLGVAAFEYMEQGDFPEALKAFRMGLAFDPAAPDFFYGQAITYWKMGDARVAQEMVARAVAAERHRPTAEWYRLKMEHVQGSPRNFIEEARHDPVYGVFVAGHLRAPNMLNRTQSTAASGRAPGNSAAPRQTNPSPANLANENPLGGSTEREQAASTNAR